MNFGPRFLSLLDDQVAAVEWTGTQASFGPLEGKLIEWDPCTEMALQRTVKTVAEAQHQGGRVVGVGGTCQSAAHGRDVQYLAEQIEEQADAVAADVHERSAAALGRHDAPVSLFSRMEPKRDGRCR